MVDGFVVPQIHLRPRKEEESSDFEGMDTKSLERKVVLHPSEIKEDYLKHKEYEFQTPDETKEVKMEHQENADDADVETEPLKNLEEHLRFPRPSRGEVRFLPDIAVGVPLLIRGGQKKDRHVLLPVKNNENESWGKNSESRTTTSTTTVISTIEAGEILAEVPLSIRTSENSKGQTFLLPLEVNNPSPPRATKSNDENRQNQESDIAGEFSVGTSLFIRNLNRPRPAQFPQKSNKRIDVPYRTSTPQPRTTASKPLRRPPSSHFEDLHVSVPLFIRGSSKGQAFIPLPDRGDRVKNSSASSRLSEKQNRRTEDVKLPEGQGVTSLLVGQSLFIVAPTQGTDLRVRKGETIITRRGGRSEDDLKAEESVEQFRNVPKIVAPNILSKPNDVVLKSVQGHHTHLHGNSNLNSKSQNVGDVKGSNSYGDQTRTHPNNTTKTHKEDDVLIEQPITTKLMTSDLQEISVFSTTEVTSYPSKYDCPEETTFRCADGTCISKTKRCDKYVHCADGSDEFSCNCSDYLRSGSQFRKICDGVADCWDYSDEAYCEWCNPGYHICHGERKCVSPLKVCDGTVDCLHGTDEIHCVRLADDETLSDHYYQNKGLVMVRKHGRWGKLCVDNNQWKVDELGEAICSALSYRNVESVSIGSETSSKSSVYFEFTPPSSELLPVSRSTHLFQPSKCEEKNVMHVTCSSLECGIRPVTASFRKRIVGGRSSSSGSWPWQVALYRDGKYQCGAVLVNDQWLVSAGHCFFRSQTGYWIARIGLLRRGLEMPSPFEQIRNISRIIIHPDYIDRGFINDLVVLRLEKPVHFSDYTRPICLPEAGGDVRKWQGQTCTVTGWGKLFEIGQIFPDTLQELQLPIIPTEDCRKRTLFLPLYRITDNMFCAGYENGGRDACLGDSGGPLMCEENGRWTLVGVTSNGDGCGRAGRPGVYTKVSKYVQWIYSVMTDGDTSPGNRSQCLGIRCPLGKCVEEVNVCDHNMDCSDGSDEINCS
ncbi:serine protease nudel-like [Limulus polyphemus]|uniref:Serine protease nudel-like n=1 Tax=Limulus polyphemus TaxID=6850 RepID=A0ABM1SSF6_LIMPO|nr:serine protease nudel-like [Limulus polyphemus]